MIRQELYTAIQAHLNLTLPGRIRHFELWNRNVEYIEQDTPWERPAIFLEYGPIRWSPFKNDSYRGTGEILLHIVTDYNSPSDSFAAFSLSSDIVSSLQGLSGNVFSSLIPLDTRTSHDHEDILESIEVMAVRYLR